MDRGWHLVSAIDCQAETNRSISKLGPEAAATRPKPRRKIEWVPNALSTTRPLLLTASKDKPVLISALAVSCDVLLTPDKGDFGILLGTTVYGMMVCTPREFLSAEGLGEAADAVNRNSCVR